LKFRAWESADREDRADGDAHEFEAAWPETAAEAWAMRKFHRQERKEYFFEVCVRMGDKVLTFEVEIELSAQAFARPVARAVAS